MGKLPTCSILQHCNQKNTKYIFSLSGAKCGCHLDVPDHCFIRVVGAQRDHFPSSAGCWKRFTLVDVPKPLTLLLCVSARVCCGVGGELCVCSHTSTPASMSVCTEWAQHLALLKAVSAGRLYRVGLHLCNHPRANMQEPDTRRNPLP